MSLVSPVRSGPVQEGEAFTKTSCYHYFHCHCLGRYASHSESELRRREKELEEDKTRTGTGTDLQVCGVPVWNRSGVFLCSVTSDR